MILRTPFLLLGFLVLGALVLAGGPAVAGGHDGGGLTGSGTGPGTGAGGSDLPEGAIARFPVEAKGKLFFPRIACSPDGKQISATNNRNGKAIVWSLPDGKAISTIDFGFDAPADSSDDTFVQVSPDSRFFLADNLKRKATRLVDARTGKAVAELDHGGMLGLFSRFSPDGERLYVFSPTTPGKMTLYSTRTGAKLPEVTLPEKLQMGSFALSPDGKTGAAFRGDLGGKFSVVTFDVAKGTVQKEIPAGTNLKGAYPESIFFSSDGGRVGARLVQNGKEPGFLVADTATGVPLQFSESPAVVLGSRFVPFTHTAVFGGKGDAVTDGRLTFHDFGSGGTALDLKLPKAGSVTSVSVCGSGRYVVTGHPDGNVTVWDSAKLFGAVPRGDENFDILWRHLGDKDLNKAHRAAWTFRTDPTLRKALEGKVKSETTVEAKRFTVARGKMDDVLKAIADPKQAKAATTALNQWILTAEGNELREAIAPKIAALAEGVVPEPTLVRLRLRLQEPYRAPDYAQRLRLAQEAVDYLRAEATRLP